MKRNDSTRRSFLKKSALTASAMTAGSLGITQKSSEIIMNVPKLPREVWIAGISQMDLRAKDPDSMVEKVVNLINDVAIYKPDIICLPEVFATSNVDEKPELAARRELSENVLQQFSSLARQFQCYIICAINTFEGAQVYNSAVLLDRSGKKLGEYRKIHLTDGEIEVGLTPGPIPPPVFRTDFGKIGIQICFDIEWDDSWAMLRDQGAEIVFWPSAFGGGQMVNTKAWRHKYIVASSTRKNTAKICDITGETIVKTGIWDKNIFCAPVNLEKVFLHTWPYVRHFNEIRKKYGRKVQITNYHEEEWSIIESLSPEVFVADIMNEFDLKTHEQHIQHAEKMQIKARGG